MTSDTLSPESQIIPFKTALVTGGGQRVGAEISHRLAALGLAVGVHFNRSADEAEAVVGTIRAKGGHAFTLKGDLSDDEDLNRLFSDNRWPAPCDVLINNASLYEKDDVFSLTPSLLDRHFQVNLRAPALLSAAFFKQLPEKKSGLIINMSDQKMMNLNPEYLSYTLTKFGIECLTKTLAMALAPRVRVAGVAPGITLPSGHQNQEQFMAMQGRLPLGRGSTPGLLADAIEFVMRCPALTGQTIVVDGGQSLIKRPTEFF